MGEPFEEVVESYAELWKWWFGAVGTYSSSVASKYADGAYTPDEYAADVSDGVKLLTEGAVYATTKFLGAQEILKHDPTKRRIFRSKDYPIKPGTKDRTLRCPHGLHPMVSNDAIPSTAVFSDPSPIPAAATSFRVCIDATGHKGLPYFGVVEITDGTTTETITVEVTAT